MCENYLVNKKVLCIYFPWRKEKEKNLNFQQASDGNVAHLLIQDKYRVYSSIGRSDRVTVTKEDSLTQERFGQILNDVYGIKKVDQTKLGLDRYKKGKDEGISWR